MATSFNPNQRVSGPFGDIFAVNTGATDRLSQQLYAEDRQREAQKIRDAKMLDDEFSKNLTNIKAADIPDVMNAYGTFKQSNKDLIKKGQKATPQDQYKVLQDKAAMMNAIKSSIEDKDYLKNHAVNIAKDTRHLYDPNAAQKVKEWMNTPTAKRNVDGDSGALMYKYSFPDYDKTTKSAAGTPTEVRGAAVADGVIDKVPVYKVGNNPNQQYTSLYNNWGSRGDWQHAAALANHIFSSDDEEQAYRNKFNIITQDPKFVEAYGKIEPFPQSALNTELGQAVEKQVIKSVVDNGIPEPKIVTETNANRKATEDYATWLKKNAITDSEKNRRMWAMFGAKNPTVTPDSIPNKMKDYESAGKTIIPQVSIVPVPGGGSKTIQPDPYIEVPANTVTPEHAKLLGTPYEGGVYHIVTLNGQKALQSRKAAITEGEMNQAEVDKHLNTAQKVRTANAFPNIATPHSGKKQTPAEIMRAAKKGN